ncbi:MAG: flavin reductase family protein [Candidatus Lokiarchaeota archaeon]|nr:flavin reductase family protein [Candidatus Lokiarchaeota archaeon]
MKITKQGNSDLFPNPVALVSSKYKDEESIITLAWVGTVCSNPPMISISIRPSRFSYGLIKRSMEFVLNIPTSKMIREIELCGTKSGKNTDKWKLCEFTRQPSIDIKIPAILECPVNLECKVHQIYSLGTHDMFIAEVLKIHRNPEWNNKYEEMVVFARGFYGKVQPVDSK